jgi:hypothetical protein
MIMAQEQAFLKAEKQLQDLIDFAKTCQQAGERIDLVERGLMKGLLAIGHSLLVGFVTSQGDGDVGPTVVDPAGHTWRRLPERHQRRYVSIFGEIDIARFVYGTREGQKIAAVPLDERLALPVGDFSYVLEDWVQRFVVQDSFEESSRSLETLLGLDLAVRTLEHMNQAMATWTVSFRSEQLAPPAAEEGTILVVTADGKGVPMRRPLGERVRGHVRRGKGEKANKKQMAYVGAVYSIDKFERTADDVVEEIQRRQRAEGRPEPQHKRVFVEMTQVYEGETINGKETLFGNLSDDLVGRNHQGEKEVVYLLDGERALWDWAEKSFVGAIGVLDLFHVLERLWLAAHCFHAEGSAAAQAFVTERLRQLLTGRVGKVIGGLRQSLTKQQPTAAKRKTLLKVIGYLDNNREHMKYDEYLAAGYPIGSGVAEGACRHVVKDRMERSGMRWTVEGAQAMLDLRTTYLNGDWDDFVEYRIQSEQNQQFGRKAA